jgi:hypothetical protein
MKALASKAQNIAETAITATTAISLTCLLGHVAVIEEKISFDSNSNI